MFSAGLLLCTACSFNKTQEGFGLRGRLRYQSQAPFFNANSKSAADGDRANSWTDAGRHMKLKGLKLAKDILTQENPAETTASSICIQSFKVKHFLATMKYAAEAISTFTIDTLQSEAALYSNTASEVVKSGCSALRSLLKPSTHPKVRNRAHMPTGNRQETIPSTRRGSDYVRTARRPHSFVPDW